MIIPIIVLSVCSNAKARVETRYWCSNSSSTTPCDTFFQQSEMTKYPPLYYMGNNTPFFQNYEQGYLLFTMVAFYGNSTYSQQYIGIYSATVRTYGGTGTYGVYTCEIGNIGGYKDNTTQYEIYSVKCPVQTTSNWYLYDLALTKYGQTEMYVKRSETVTFVSDVSDANAIVSSQQQAAQNEINAINNMSSSMQAALGTHATNIINSMQTATQQEVTAINDIKNYEARQGDGDSSRPDDQEVDDYINSEDQVIASVENMLTPIQQLTYDLTQFNEAFEWIWDTIDNLIHTHVAVFSSVIIMLFCGLAKLVLCR